MRHSTYDGDENDGRVMLAVGGPLFIPMALMMTWSLIFVIPQPQGALESGLLVLLQEMAMSAVLFFSVGFLWAVSGNRSLKKLLDVSAKKLAWLLVSFAIPVFAVMAYKMIFN